MGPGKEEDHSGGGLGGGGTDGGEDSFEIVLEFFNCGELLSKNWRSRLTTQTPAIPYLPSAAFRNMTLALFSDRSSLAGSVMFVWPRPLRLHYYKALAGSLIDNRSFNDELHATKVSFGWTDMQQPSHQWKRILATLLHGDDFAIGPQRRHQRDVQLRAWSL